MLWILCIDGLGYDLWNEFGLRLPYQGELTISKELYRNNYPFTPDVWGSMFTGKIFKHPKSKETEINPIRHKIRTFLRDRGIRWSRRGTKVKYEGTGDFVPSYMVFEQKIEKSVFDKYNSFTWGIPSLYDGFVFKSLSGNKQDHEAFKSMIYSQYCKAFDLVGIYTHLIDMIAHRVIKKDDRNHKQLKMLYHDIFFLYKDIIKRGDDVIIVSDHSCLGKHGDYAFIGSNKEYCANTILDVYDVIINYMGEQK